MSLKKRLTNLETTASLGTTQHVSVDADKYELTIHDSIKHFYSPPATCLEFHKSNDFVRFLMGPFGSGKSTSCASEIILRTCAMPCCLDGVRRARWPIVRNTYGDLEATSLKTWLHWFGELGQIAIKKHPRITCTHTFNDGNGIIELEILFIALDKEASLRQLLSLEATGVYINEVSEISQKATEMFQGRVGRYPSPTDCKEPFFSGIIADTNPPPTDHWIYKKFEILRPKGFTMFHQPPAVFKTENGYEINPNADNLKNYVNGEKYYMDMIMGQTEEFIKVYAMGKYGIVIIGKPVYPGYNDDLHSVPVVKPNKNYPIRMGDDYGVVCPAVVLAQHINGRLFVFKEFIGEYITIKELYEKFVEPWLNDNCKNMAIEVVKGDPANTDHGKEQLQELGYIVENAKTNNNDPRIGAVMELLNGLVVGKAQLVISREGCPTLREGFLGQYNYKRLKIIGEEKYRDVPDKKHPWSDVHDGLQYIAMDITDIEFEKTIPEEEEEFDFDAYYHERDSDNVTGY